jgi:hypothetical protein
MPLKKTKWPERIQAESGLELGYLLGIDTFLGSHSSRCFVAASDLLIFTDPANGIKLKLFKISLLFILRLI